MMVGTLDLGNLDFFVKQWNALMAIHITYNETKLSIDVYGNITLIGNTKDAAIGLVEYVNTVQNYGTTSIILNNSLEIDLENNQLLYHCNDKSEMMLELIKEFNKAAKLKAFW